MSLIQEKFNWVVSRMDEWQLTEAERSILLGFNEASALPANAEARFNLISNMKNVLTVVFSDGDGDGDRHHEAEATWLRTPISPLDNQSPLDFITNDDENHTKLTSVVRSMHGP